MPERLGCAGTPWQPGRRAGGGPGDRLPGLCAEEQCRLHGIQGGHARCRRERLAGGAAAPAQRPDQADEGAGLRRGIPLRPRRAGCLCCRRGLFPRGPGTAPLLPAGTARPGTEDRRQAGPSGRAGPAEHAPEAPMMVQILAVAAGGALGSVLRFLAGVWVTASWPRHGYLATLAVNLLGCLLIGLLARSEEHTSEL